jgi:hypothetical protein
MLCAHLVGLVKGYKLISRHLPEGTEKNHGPKSSMCAGRSLNRVPPEYKCASALTAECYGESRDFSTLVARMSVS